MSQSTSSLGFLQLLRQNPNYRNLWFGQVISYLGDWFCSAALYSLVESLTGSGRAVAWVLMLQFLPFFFLGPITGVVADRFPRRIIMMTADALRAMTILGLLLIRRPDQVWMVYVIVGLTEVCSAFFEPARQALLPAVCQRSELFTANALSAMTWSLTLTVGSGLGALTTLLVGRSGTFLLDSCSFVLSAFFIWRIQTRIPTEETKQISAIVQNKPEFGWRSSLAEMREGIQYVVQRPAILSFVLVKTAAGLGGGLLVLLTMFGQRIFPIGHTGTAVALLYASRGMGTALGPVFARRLGGESPRVLRKGIGWAFFIYGFFYIVFGHAPNLILAMLALIVAHIGGSIQWVNSTVLLQLSVPDKYRGRIFAWEWGLLTLAAAISNYVVGWLLDVIHLTPQQAAMYVGTYLMLPGILWAFLQVWLAKDYTKVLRSDDSFEPVVKTA